MCAHGLHSQPWPSPGRSEAPGPKREGSLNGESTRSGDGSVCSVLRCPVVGGAVSVLSSSVGCLLLGEASPVFVLGVALLALVPLTRMSFIFILSYLYEDFLTTLYRFDCVGFQDCVVGCVFVYVSKL